VFGSTISLFEKYFAKFGIDQWSSPLAPIVRLARRRCARRTKLLFVETPSNPLTEVVDIAALAQIAHARRAAGGRQLLLHAGAAAAAASWAPTSSCIRHQVPRRPGPRARRRGGGAQRAD
jgi:hypothetical protein